MPVLRNVTTGSVVATRIDRLGGFLQRLVGLLNRRSLNCNEGVWLASCRAIHTLGMRYPIDVVFMDREGVVLRICANVRPNCLALSCNNAKAVVELGCGMLDTTDILVGDRLELA